MFHLKLTLLYFFTIVLVVSVMWIFIDASQDSYVKEELFPSLKSASKSYVHLTRDRVATLKDFSAGLLASDLPVYVKLLKEHKELIRNTSNKTRQAFPRRGKVPPERILQFVEQETRAELDAFEKRVDQELKQKLRLEGGYASYLKDVFASCMAEGDPWAICYFKFTYLPLTRIIFPAQKAELAESFPELFILVDNERNSRLLFDNLATSVEKLEQEDVYVAGVRYKDHIIENFDQIAGVISQLESSYEPMISSHLILNDSRVFVTVASRISGDDGQFLGSIIVGYALDNGSATVETSEVLGVRPVLEGCLETSGDNQTSEELCEYELGRQAKGITYLAENKKRQLVRPGTTLNETKANITSQHLKSLKAHPSLADESMLAFAVPFPLDYKPDEDTLFAVLTVDLEAALTMFTTMKVILLILGILVFLVGVILIQALVRSYAKPFEQIDAGVHEIIGGNFDYTFPFAFREELPRSMAQSLTIMKAVLLGQPLPEDVERDDSWAENLQVEGEQPMLDSAEITGDNIGEASEIEEITADQVKESATEYYRRLYKEYLDARSAAGEDVSSITYIKFVEKIAKTEKGLREKFECKQVLFKVVTKNKDVVLIPIKVLEKK